MSGALFPPAAVSVPAASAPPPAAVSVPATSDGGSEEATIAFALACRESFGAVFSRTYSGVELCPLPDSVPAAVEGSPINILLDPRIAFTDKPVNADSAKMDGLVPVNPAPAGPCKEPRSV